MPILDDIVGGWSSLAGDSMAMGVEQILIHLLIAFLLGQFLGWVYLWSHRSVSYSRSNVHALVMLALIVTSVMLAVGNNLARAFGLFGALALVRFRTPVKDARDTSFLFMSVGIGIAVGASQFALAIVGTGVMGLVALYLSHARFGERFDRNAVLRFMMPADGDKDLGLRRVLARHCKRAALVQLREVGPDAGTEFAYQLTMYDPEASPELLDELREIPGMRGLNIFLQGEGVEP